MLSSKTGIAHLKHQADQKQAEAAAVLAALVAGDAAGVAALGEDDVGNGIEALANLDIDITGS